MRNRKSSICTSSVFFLILHRSILLSILGFDWSGKRTSCIPDTFCIVSTPYNSKLESKNSNVPLC